MSAVMAMRIREAGDRLLTQAKQGAEVKLTLVELSKEAGISRATISKPEYAAEREKFKKKVATFEATGKVPNSPEKGLVYENERLLKELEDLKSENKELRVLVKAYAGKLQVNSLKPESRSYDE